MGNILTFPKIKLLKENIMKKYIGIDISKNTFDVCIISKNEKPIFKKYLYKNSEIKKFIALINKSKVDVLVGMENSGIYHLKLATALYSHNIKTVVIHPLRTKRFSQMKMKRVKTDKQDALMITQYIMEQPSPEFKPIPQNQVKMRYLLQTIEDLIKIKVQISNQLEAISLVPTELDLINETMTAHFQSIKKSIKELEKELKLLISNSYSKAYENLKTIAGVGDRIATAFVAYFGSFESFDNSRQVISFLGTNPGTFESGTSVKRPGAISKRGNRYLRKLLYMGAMTACRKNLVCCEMHKRLKAKGKKGKVIIIAVANKLLRQMFAISKSSIPFDENYKPILFKNA